MEVARVEIPVFELAQVVKATPMRTPYGDVDLHQAFHSRDHLGYVFHVGEAWVGKRSTNTATGTRTAEGASTILYQCRGHDKPILWVSNYGEPPGESVCEHIRSVCSLDGFPVGRPFTLDFGNARHIWFNSFTSIKYSVFLSHILPLDAQRMGYTFLVASVPVDKFPVGRSGQDGYWCGDHGGRITTGNPPRWRSDQPLDGDLYCRHIKDVHTAGYYPTRADRYELLDGFNERELLLMLRRPSTA